MSEDRPKMPSGPESTVVVQSVTEKAGDTIGRYKLREKIGEGGWGAVYVAEQEEPVRRRVALKVIKPGMDSRQVIARFEAERQALAMMDHPNIARVLDAGTTDNGRPYFVMELVRGIRITDYCDQNKLPPRERLDLFIQVCHAVQHAHQKGIIHRDLKPSNILVTLHDGVPVPKVIDFGIAKATEGRLTNLTVYTELHQFIGTPAYMSPEQAEMSGLDIDTRSDIYSLGVLLYELLTGQTPLDSDQLLRSGLDEMRRKIREDEPKRPSTRLSTMGMADAVTVAKSHGAQIPALVKIVRGDLDWIVMKCLEKDRTRRYETANGLAMDIQRHLRNETIVARPPSATYRFQKLVRRNKLAFTAVTGIALALVVGLAVAAIGLVRERAARLRAVAAEREQSRLREEAQRAQQAEAGLRAVADEQRRRAEANLYVADMNLANQALGQGNIARARQLLAAHRDHQPDLRGFEWRYLWTKSRGQHVREFAGHAAPLNEVAWSPDGRLLASRSLDDVLKVWEVASGKELATVDGITLLGGFMPDDRRLLVSKEDGIYTYDSTSRQSQLVVKNAGLVLRLLTDGQTVASTHADFALKLWDLATGREKLELAGHGGFHNREPTQDKLAVAISPDGARAAVLHSPSGGSTFIDYIELWDVQQRQVRARLPEKREIRWIKFSDDGNSLVACGTRGIVTLWNVASNSAPSEPRVLHPHDVTIRAAAFSGDGRLLATGSSDQSINILDLASGNKLLTFRGHENSVCPVVFSPDGKRLASGSVDQTVKVWDIRPPEPQLIGTAEGAGIASLWSYFSPDGSLMAAHSGTNTMRVWETATQRERLVIDVPRNRSAPLGFTPDNKSLLVFRAYPWQVEIHSIAGRNMDRAIPLEDPSSLGNYVPGLAAAPAQRLLAVSSVDAIHLWDLFTGRKLLKVQTSNTVGMLVFSPDQSTLIGSTRDDSAGAEAPRTLHFWEARSLRLINSIPVRFGGSPNEVAFSVDGKLMATSGSYRKTVDLWDVATGQHITALTGHRQGTYAVSFSPDGRILASGSSDGTVKLWNIALRQEVATLLFNEDELPDVDIRVSAVRFSQDGNTLVAISNAGVLKYFRATSWAEIDRQPTRETPPAY
jgi:WD40 repeat protein/tRNA A-37 threonylcarbamoyl transferase component Bud32